MNILTTAYTVSSMQASDRSAPSATFRKGQATETQAKPTTSVSRMLKAISNRIHSLVSATGTLRTREASRSALDAEFGSNVSLEKIGHIGNGDFVSIEKFSPSKPSDSLLPMENRSWLHDVHVPSQGLLDTSGSSASRGISTVELANELSGRSALSHDEATDHFDDDDSGSECWSDGEGDFDLAPPVVRIRYDDTRYTANGYESARVVEEHFKSDAKQPPLPNKQPRHANIRRTPPPMCAEEIARIEATHRDADNLSWASGKSFLI